MWNGITFYIKAKNNSIYDYNDKYLKIKSSSDDDFSSTL